MRVPLLLIGILSAGLAATGVSVPLHAQRPMPDLVISEVLPNSGQGSRDAAFEWVEIENQKGRPISLGGWVLEDNHARDALPEITLPAGGFVLLVASQDGADAVDAAAQIAVVADGRIGNGLANSGDRLLLIDPTRTAVDGLSWGTDRSVARSVAPPAGLSLSRRAGMRMPRVGEPAPGAASLPPQPAAGDAPVALVCTEIFANAGAGPRDAAFEWIELYSSTDGTVERSGWLIADNGGSDRLGPGKIAPGGYLVVAGSLEATAQDALIIADGRLGNGLAKGGYLILLLDPAGRERARVDFSGPPLPRPEAGTSLALDDGSGSGTSNRRRAARATPALSPAWTAKNREVAPARAMSAARPHPKRTPTAGSRRSPS